MDNVLAEIFALSHLYLGGGIGYVEQPKELPAQFSYWKWDCNEVDNPQGIFKMGYLWEPTRTITVDLNARHESFILVNDRGKNSINLEVTWRPFRR